MISHNPRHYLMYINWVLFLILLLEIVFYFSVFPRVAVSKIELDSDLPLSDDDVRKLLNFATPRNYYSVDVVELEQYARGFALVADIQISKEFPNRLKVRLQSRKPVLVILQKKSLLATAQNKGTKETESWRSVPILVDTEGVMFQFGLGGYDDVPVLSGLKFSQGNPLNSRLPPRLYPLVAALGGLKRDRPKLYAIISEVQTHMDMLNLETNIYLENTPSYIKTSGKIDAHTIETALVAMEVLQRGNEATDYLDMRTTGIVYRPKKGGPALAAAKEF